MTTRPSDRRRHLQAFDRRQHADRRRDHAVAEQQPGAEHQRPQHEPRDAVGAVVQQPVKRKDAALALVLRAQNQQRVFDRDDHRQRPDHQRDAAQHVLRRPRHAGLENLVHGVKRRGADVAVNDAERAKRQRRQPAARRMRAVRRPSAQRRRGPAARREKSSRLLEAGHPAIMHPRELAREIDMDTERASIVRLDTSSAR